MSKREVFEQIVNDKLQNPGDHISGYQFIPATGVSGQFSATRIGTYEGDRIILASGVDDDGALLSEKRIEPPLNSTHVGFDFEGNALTRLIDFDNTDDFGI